MGIDYANVQHQPHPLTLMTLPSHLFIIVGNRADESGPARVRAFKTEEDSMGLFDRFKADQGQQMTPHLAFATSLIYCMGADGEMDNEEIGHLLSVLGGATERGQIGVGANNRALLDQAVRIARTKPLDQFLAEVTPILTDAQRMCILLNLVDSAMADGDAEGEEQDLVARFQRAFEVPDERFVPFFEALHAKNDRSVFLNPEHPHNRAGYVVEINGLERRAN